MVLLAIWDHTVLADTRHKWTHPVVTPAREAGTRLPWRDGRLSWLRWLVTYRDGLPLHRQSTIQVLTWQQTAGSQTCNQSDALTTTLQSHSIILGLLDASK